MEPFLYFFFCIFSFVLMYIGAELEDNIFKIVSGIMLFLIGLSIISYGFSYSLLIMSFGFYLIIKPFLIKLNSGVIKW